MPTDPLQSVHDAPWQAGSASPASSDAQRERRLPPIFLFPGLAADKRLFAPLLPHVPTIRTPGWLAPQRKEPLERYAVRMAQVVRKDLDRLDAEHAKAPRTRLRPSERYFLGGFSFGGQVALEMVHALFPKPAGLLLICGVRGRHQLLPAFHRQQRLGAIIPGFLQRPLFGPYARHFAKQEKLDAPATDLLVSMAKANDPDFLKWSAWACSHWQGTPRGIIASTHTLQPARDETYDIPIHHLHGEHDSIIPDVRHEATTTLAGARHLITLTHATRVSDWMRDIVTGQPR
jgi:alpha-beta hydrolase superfamily lysophospholipase